MFRTCLRKEIIEKKAKTLSIISQKFYLLAKILLIAKLSESKWSFCISLIAKMGDGLPNTAFLFQNSAFRFGNTGNKEEEE